MSPGMMQPSSSGSGAGITPEMQKIISQRQSLGMNGMNIGMGGMGMGNMPGMSAMSGMAGMNMGGMGMNGSLGGINPAALTASNTGAGMHYVFS